MKKDLKKSIKFEKIQLNKTYGYSNFISNEVKNKFLNWISENKNLFNKNSIGEFREYCLMNDTFSIYENVSSLKNKIIELENITDYKTEPVYQDFIGINYEKGKIHLHSDKNEEPYVHVRYNIILSMPIKGGHSIYGGNENKLTENLVWKCIAGKVEHASTEVVGDKPRITLSLGFLINKRTNSHIFSELEDNKKIF